MPGTFTSDRLPSVRIGNVPTPIYRLDRLSAHLNGPAIYLKHDDFTGFGLGGNKIRKLEFLIADALASGADTLVTTGGIQSNHCRQTAAVAARFGMGCELLLAQLAHTEPQYRTNGNALLDELYGAKLTFCDGSEAVPAGLEEICDRLRRQGRAPYVIPMGGSSAVGSFGYIRACEEMAGQIAGLDLRALVHSTGSAGTQAGLIAGMTATGLAIPVLGISCGASADVLGGKVDALLDEIAATSGIARNLFGRVAINDAYVGSAYGVPTDAMLEAVRLVARTEGILLDPVYTGKAMAGLIDLISSGMFEPGDEILFLHSGGTPGLFGYADTLAAACHAEPAASAGEVVA